MNKLKLECVNLVDNGTYYAYYNMLYKASFDVFRSSYWGGFIVTCKECDRVNCNYFKEISWKNLHQNNLSDYEELGYIRF